ncbi:hypothetical protein OHU11_03230 [Streptomyces sp. NBC_00257]|uniref:hypothetical protein n=1 Tax=unclassified Streptomyces TaxID=2593676 RepID=UPI00225A03A7|nr:MULTISPECIES: hypothetical protein [unclassified Streptomyces]WTB59008.1 hypothetical protein OG832_40660 [Streptomyces sp. NBC_00826]WTH88117.1 hypothetical protein OIC43_03055 [Streptomyces sp. NBC_00825]WTH96844.1 hypothetical protein OHA23_03055 [Streptomyces sp. NBC_00822]MCX4870759.1 hypothetical protein [Streptomyces sp. NBC_00906]MCX4901499.1 hypothetical protein [Streptomyces sp. NBC_00892]
MHTRKFRTAIMLCAATALAAAIPLPASASASAPAATDSHPSTRVVAVDCFSNPQVRPGDFLLACGDGNNRLIDIHWSHWGPTSAVGRALDAVNDCDPYCAAGKFHTYPVIVRLDRPETWKTDSGLRQFTRMQLVYTDGRPAHTERVVTHELWD